MSKAFVIKNKEGEYLQFFDEDSDDIGFTDDLTLAELYDKNEKDIMEKAYSNMEWEYIEITLQETKDLKQDINESLEQQLTKKDKEIKELKAKLETAEYWNKKYDDLQSQKDIQTIRKQVCDEIRNLAHNYFELVICDNCGNPIDDDCYMSSTDFCKILEQVEKVEE